LQPQSTGVPKALAIPYPCRARRHNWLKSWQKSIGHADFGCAAALELEARSDQGSPPLSRPNACRSGDQQGNKQQSQEHSNAETCVWREGLGVPRDFIEATKWYRLAADQGYAGARNNFGTLTSRLIFGDDAPERQRNSQRNLVERRTIYWMITAERPKL